MYVCSFRRKNNIAGKLHRINSFQWQLVLDHKSKPILTGGNELITYLQKDLDSGELELIDGIMPKVVK